MPEAPCCDDLGHNAGVSAGPAVARLLCGTVGLEMLVGLGATVGVRGRRWRFFTGRMFLPADFIMASFKQTAPTSC